MHVSFENQLLKCVKFSRAEPRPIPLTMQLPWLLAWLELQSIVISQYAKLLNQNLTQKEFTGIKSKRWDGISYQFPSEKHYL